MTRVFSVALAWVLSLFCLNSITEASVVYQFNFPTSQSLGNTGSDGEVSGYFRVNNASGMVSSSADAFAIDQLVITSDTTGAGFAPTNTNLFTYSDAVYSGWQLLSYNGLILDGTNYVSGSIIFAGISGGSVGGSRSGLTLGIDSSNRVGILTYNPDGGVDLGNRRTASGNTNFGNSTSIMAVPEPSSFTACGLAFLFILRRRNRSLVPV